MFTAPSRVYRFLLKRLLGEILAEDLQLEQLDVRLRQGRVELTNLVLNPETIEHWILGGDSSPIRVRTAKIGLVRLQVPGPDGDSCLLEICGLDVSCITKDDSEPPPPSPVVSPSPPLVKKPSTTTTAAASTSDTEVKEGLDFLGRWIERVTSRLRVEIRDVNLSCTSSTSFHVLRLIVERISYYSPPASTVLNHREIRIGGRVTLTIVPVVGRCELPLVTLSNTSDSLLHMVFVGDAEEMNVQSVDLSTTWVAIEIDADAIQALMTFFPVPLQKQQPVQTPWNPEQSLILGEAPLESSMGARNVELLKTVAPSLFGDRHDIDELNLDDDDDDDEFLDAFDGEETSEQQHSSSSVATITSNATKELRVRIQRLQISVHGKRVDVSDQLDNDLTWLEGGGGGGGGGASWSHGNNSELYGHDGGGGGNDQQPSTTTFPKLVFRGIGVLGEVNKSRRRIVGTLAIRHMHVSERVSSLLRQQHGMWARNSPLLSFATSSPSSPFDLSASTLVTSSSTEQNFVATFDSDTNRSHITLSPCTVTCDMGILTRFSSYVLVLGGGGATTTTIPPPPPSFHQQQSPSTAKLTLSLSCSKLTMHLIPISNVNAFRTNSPRLTPAADIGSPAPASNFAPRKEDDSLLVTLDDFFAASDRATSSGGVVHLLNHPSKLHVLSLMRRQDVPLSLKIKFASDVLTRRVSAVNTRGGNHTAQRPPHLNFESSQEDSSDEDEAAYDAVSAKFCARAVAEAGVSIEVFIPRIEAHDLWGETYQRAIAAGQLFVRKDMDTSNDASGNGGGRDDEVDTNSETPFLVLACDAGTLTFKDESGGPDLRLSFVGASLSCADGTDFVVRISDLSLDEMHDNKTLCVPILYSTKYWGGSKDTAMLLMLVQQSLDHSDNNNNPASSTMAQERDNNTCESSVSVCLRGATIRFEPASTWFPRSNRLMIPDGRSFPNLPVWFTNLRFAAYDLLVDYSPSQSPKPYLSPITHDHRAIVSFGRFRSRANIISVATIQTYKFSARDVDVFLASPAPLRDDEFETRVIDRSKTNKPTFSNVIEFAQEARFVRVGSVGQFRADVRVRGPPKENWDLELFAPDISLFMCTDSFAAVLDLAECLSTTTAVAQQSGNVGQHHNNNSNDLDDDHMFQSVWVVDRSGVLEPPAKPSIAAAPPAPAPHTNQPSMVPIKLPPSSFVKDNGDDVTSKHPQKRPSSPPPHDDLPAPPSRVFKPPKSRQNTNAPPQDHELSAKDLRERYATMPDDQLTAAQLRVRYSEDVHLVPFVIDDFYSIGSLPAMKQREGDEDDGNTARWLTAAGTTATRANNATRDEWSFVESLVDDPSPPPSPPPSNDAAALMSRSFFLGSTNNNVVEEEIQLLTSEEIEEQSKRGNRIAMDLRTSYHHLQQDAFRADAEAEDEVKFEANEYSSALAESRASVEIKSTPAIGASKLWHPGTSLVLEEESGTDQQQQQSQHNADDGSTNDDEVDGNPYGEDITPTSQTQHAGSMSSSSSSPSNKSSSQIEEPFRSPIEQTARWFEPANEVRVFAHHLGVPYPPGPGSHVPPATALAAAKLLGRDTTSVRATGCMVLRDVGINWRIFSGLDFSYNKHNKKVPTTTTRKFPLPAAIHEDDDDENDTISSPQPFRTVLSPLTGVLGQAVVENHMDPLFPRDRAETAPAFGSRDLDKAVELVARGVSAFVEWEGDADMFVAVSVGDFDVFDHVKTSSIKRMVGAWMNDTLHPRETDAAMLRMAMEKNKHEQRVCVATLPLSVSANQDTITMLSGLMEQFASTTMSGNGSSTNTTTTSSIVLDMRACKLKLDYIPIRVDLTKVKDGDYTEILNLFTYQGIEVALRRVRAQGESWQDVKTEIIKSWSTDVTNKALYKLLAGVSSPPLATAAALGTGMVNLVLLPIERYRSGGGIKGAAQTARDHASCFAKTLMVEAMGAGANLSSMALNLVDAERKGARPDPQNVREGFAVAGEALSRGLKQAHHTIVAVPLTEWRREGSVVKAVIRAVPVAILQPLVGATEAAEAAFKGVRNQMDKERARDEKGKWKKV